MVKERYVSFEVATLLKDKGFDGEVHNWYIGDENLQAPSQAVACDWVEETYNINIDLWTGLYGYEITISHALKTPALAGEMIHRDDMPSGDNIDGSWSNKELAYDDILKYILTNLV